jgi:hypothetical protein
MSNIIGIGVAKGRQMLRRFLGTPSSNPALLLARPESTKVQKSDALLSNEKSTDGEVSQVVFYSEFV